MAQDESQIDRAARGRASAWSWLANLVVATLIGADYLWGALPAATWQAWLFLPLALVSSLAVLSIVPGLPLWLVARLVPMRGRALALSASHAAIWTLFQLAVFSDTRIYRLFRYHYNGMVWNVMTTPGSEDAVELGTSVWIKVALGALVLFLFQLWLFRRLLARASQPGVRRSRVPRVAFALIVLAVLGEKVLYAHADLVRDRSVTALARLYPLYQRVTIERFARDKLGMKLDERAKVELGGGSLLLRYPLEEPSLSPSGPRPNILVIAIDSLRRDALEATRMPELARFAPRARVFQDHVSGGCSTRFGLFTLLYGLHGTYWHAVLGEHAPPVLIRALQGAGYEFKVLSAASMNFPELRSTAWASVEDTVEDAFEGPKYARDEAIAARFDAWLDERASRSSTSPYFAFLLIDSPHQPYSVAPDVTPFEPYEEGVDYLEMSSDPSPELRSRVENRFWNAVAHSDRVVGGVLASLEKRGELARTIVVVTGDHGEEFYEHGFWGHSSNYTLEQVAVTFVVAGPGISPGVETRPTSHIDLAPTLLELLGADPTMRAQWSNGGNLLDPPSERTRVISGWDDVVLWKPDAILRAPTESHSGSVEVYDANWNPHPDEDRVLRESGAALAGLARDCRRFLR